jgi:hypothetical protein
MAFIIVQMYFLYFSLKYSLLETNILLCISYATSRGRHAASRRVTHMEGLPSPPPPHHTLVRACMQRLRTLINSARRRKFEQQLKHSKASA